MVTPAKPQGSLIDAVTLVALPFYYEPKVRVKERTAYAAQGVIGSRLPVRQWIGEGDAEVILDVYLLDQSTMQKQLDNFHALLEPQDDTGKPHPVYIHMGDLFLGRQFLLYEISIDPQTYQYGTLVPYETEVKFKLVELAPGA